MKFATKHDRNFLLRKALFLRYGFNITIDLKKEELCQPVLPIHTSLLLIVLLLYIRTSHRLNSSTNFYLNLFFNLILLHKNLVKYFFPFDILLPKDRVNLAPNTLEVYMSGICCCITLKGAPFVVITQWHLRLLWLMLVLFS